MSSAAEILRLARAELGTRESPAGSNNVKYNTAYYGQEMWDGKAGGKYPWCVVFLWWLFHQAGADGLFYGGKKTASCSALMAYAKANGQWVTGGYRPGDLVIYDFPGGAATDHCGVVVCALSGGVRAIEGNTSAGNDSNGGTVMERDRPASYIVGAYRPRYEEDDMITVESIKAMDDAAALALAERLQAALGTLAQTGSVGAELEEAKALGITDGSRPKSFCTRAQAAVMVKRALGK